MHLETCGLRRESGPLYQQDIFVPATLRVALRMGRGALMAQLASFRIFAFFALAIPALAQRDPLFKTEILPVLEKNCVQCHGPQQKMARLDLSSFTGMMEGSSNGPVIALGKPERSLMWKLIESGQMPQGGKLTTADKQLIKSYIQYGRFPAATAETEAAIQAREAARVTQEDRNWWSFRKPVKSPVPPVTNPAQVRTPIDAFVLAQLEHKGWRMQPEADRPILIRRAYFDLVGLPPTPAEVMAFVEDQSPNAWERVIDRLLASPHYGEQWGRHWLDVAGYSDSDGYSDLDPARPWAYKYRDYVIRSINSDKPFDEFIREQLAGDEMVPQ